MDKDKDKVDRGTRTSRPSTHPKHEEAVCFNLCFLKGEEFGVDTDYLFSLCEKQQYEMLKTKGDLVSRYAGVR